MDPDFERELITAISTNDLGKCEALIQNVSELHNYILLSALTLTQNVDIFRALLKHSSVNPFYDDSLIHFIIKLRCSADFLTAVLEHPANHLTADHYHAFISSCDHSKEKQDLLQAYLSKL